MHVTLPLLLFVATLTSVLAHPQQPAIKAATNYLPLGAICSTTSQCANGAQCYGITSSTITTCGSFQASCSSNSQCATNTCQSGTCQGLIASPNTCSYGGPSCSTTTSSTSSSVRPSSTITPGTLALGAICSQTSDCAYGAQCYGVTSFTIRTCGSFQASCSRNAQCATNTCQSGSCQGLISSSPISSSPSSSTTYTFTGSSSSADATTTKLIVSSTSTSAPSTITQCSRNKISTTSVFPTPSPVIGRAGRKNAGFGPVLVAVGLGLVL